MRESFVRSSSVHCVRALFWKRETSRHHTQTHASHFSFSLHLVCPPMPLTFFILFLIFLRFFRNENVHLNLNSNIQSQWKRKSTNRVNIYENKAEPIIIVLAGSEMHSENRVVFGTRMLFCENKNHFTCARASRDRVVIQFTSKQKQRKNEEKEKHVARVPTHGSTPIYVDDDDAKIYSMYCIRTRETAVTVLRPRLFSSFSKCLLITIRSQGYCC